jgi:hypothetical protein
MQFILHMVVYKSCLIYRFDNVDVTFSCLTKLCNNFILTNSLRKEKIILYSPLVSKHRSVTINFNQHILIQPQMGKKKQITN